MERRWVKISAEIVSLISSAIVALFTLLGVVYSSKKAQSKNEALIEAKMDKMQEINKMTFSRIEEKIVDLTKAQERHNSVIERTYNLEKEMGEANRSLKSAFNNIDELRSDVREVRTTVDGLDKQVTDIKLAGARLEEKLNK